jgi:vacuolar protein sorting-associated protein 72
MADDYMVDTPVESNDPDSDSSDSSSDEEQVEWLATTREKRSTAGNRLNSLIAQEAEDDELELLFAEDEDDAGFEIADEDASDVQMDSSDDDDDQGPAAGGEELEGEKELQAQAKAERSKKRKANDGIPKMFRKKVKIDPTLLQSTPPRPKKKSERVSWIPTTEGAPTRASARQTTKLSKEQLHIQMVDREKRRLRQLANMEKAAKRKEADKPKAVTQEDRLAEAARIEKKNSKSLNRWEEAEKAREEEQMAKLAALHNRKMEGPVISWWSGFAEFVDGRLRHLGKGITIEEKEKPLKRKKLVEEVVEGALTVKGPVEANQPAESAKSSTESAKSSTENAKSSTENAAPPTEIPEIVSDASKNQPSISNSNTSPAITVVSLPVAPKSNPPPTTNTNSLTDTAPNLPNSSSTTDISLPPKVNTIPVVPTSTVGPTASIAGKVPPVSTDPLGALPMIQKHTSRPLIDLPGLPLHPNGSKVQMEAAASLIAAQPQEAASNPQNQTALPSTTSQNTSVGQQNSPQPVAPSTQPFVAQAPAQGPTTEISTPAPPTPQLSLSSTNAPPNPSQTMPLYRPSNPANVGSQVPRLMPSQTEPFKFTAAPIPPMEQPPLIERGARNCIIFENFNDKVSREKDAPMQILFGRTFPKMPSKLSFHRSFAC